MINKDVVLLRLVGPQNLETMIEALKGIHEMAMMKAKNMNCQTYSGIEVKANKSAHIEIGIFTDKKKTKENNDGQQNNTR